MAEVCLLLRKKGKNASGVPGITYKKRAKHWKVFMTVAGRRLLLGNFPTFEEAVKARQTSLEAAKKAYAQVRAKLEGQETSQL